MKKTLLISALFVTMSTAIYSEAKSQTSNSVANLLSVRVTGASSESIVISESEVDARVLNNFANAFSVQAQVVWTLEKAGYRAYFSEKGTQHRIMYNKKGRWMQTIKSFSRELLQTEIIDAIENAFDGYEVVGVTEVQIPGYTVYFTNIQSSRRLKEVVYYNGDITVRNEYDRN
jgi:hypothetical protein